MSIINSSLDASNLDEAGDKSQLCVDTLDGTIDDIRYLINKALSDGDLYGIIDIISKINHPASNSFSKWLKRNQENIEWYSNNLGKIELVGNCIKILGDTIELQNEKSESDGENIFKIEGKTYFKHNAIGNYLETVGRKLVDFEEIVKILPGDIENKIDFFVSVLGLELFGYYNSNGNSGLNPGGWYWSKAESVHSKKAMKISGHRSDDLGFPMIFDSLSALSLRCAKK